MKHLAVALSLAALIPSCPRPVYPAIDVCDCQPIYGDPFASFEGVTPALAKWSGRIIPDLPLSGTGVVRFTVSANGVTIYTDTFPWASFMFNSGKWQYSNPAAVTGGIRKVEFAPHSGGWLVTWWAYSNDWLLLVPQVVATLEVDMHCYETALLLTPKKHGGWYMP